MYKPKLSSKPLDEYDRIANICFQAGMHDIALKMMEEIYAFKYDNLKTCRSLNYIKRVNFEISAVCNLKCKYCTFRSGKRKSYLDPALFEKILHELGRDVPGLERLALYMSGESLLHPQFVELLDIVAAVKKEHPSFRPCTYLHTNGMLWMPKMNDRIMQTGALDQVVWSIDGTNPESFERMRAGADYDQVMANYAYFLSHKPDDVETIINNLVETPSDPSEYDPGMRELFARADRVNTIMPKPLNEKKDRSVCQWIGNPKGFCDYIFHTVVVTTSGQMSLCCIDYNSLNAFGDLTKNSFVDTYFSQEHFDILRKMADGNRSAIKGCVNCKVLKNAWSTDSAKRTSSLPFGYSWIGHVRERWQEWGDQQGVERVALFGAGEHTHALESALQGQPGPTVVAVLDDRPNQRAAVFGLSPRRACDFSAKDVDAVVLSSDCVQERMEKRCRELFGAKVVLLDLYEGLPPGPYAK